MFRVIMNGIIMEETKVFSIALLKARKIKELFLQSWRGHHRR